MMIEPVILNWSITLFIIMTLLLLVKSTKESDDD
jgi:hypothetical protein